MAYKRGRLKKKVKGIARKLKISKARKDLAKAEGKKTYVSAVTGKRKNVNTHTRRKRY